jgi:hypothetical protein
MNMNCFKFFIASLLVASMMLELNAKQPPANIASDATKHEANLLTKPQRDQLQVEMIGLQRDIIAAYRDFDKLPEIKAAKDEMLQLREKKAPRKEISAA